jgi:alginate O-acetyltransferase complex protein AlgI
MLFNSYPFLLAFLPITLAGFFLIGRFQRTWAAAWLALASIVFYGWWDQRYIGLLLASVILNYWCSLLIRNSTAGRSKRWLVMALVINLCLLGYYKYAAFFVSSVANLSGAELAIPSILLPVGISFFTFTQIAFLVDTYQGKVRESRFVHYLLFVTYFPHLIAGPVLHHKEMMPQFADDRNYIPLASNFAVGMTIFVIGLAKKVLIADNLAPYANNLFNDPGQPSLLLAWGGVLAYTFQLYFDFSGYSDMAIGLSRLFGVRLPLNFDSPYKSRNIAEFWRRWHMTLSRFLRDYLYIPLGGNRHGEGRRNLNLLATMFLGGLWHGAGWTFAIWGALHGLFLVVNQFWSKHTAHFAWSRGRTASVAATCLTFVAVCYAWVFFRAADFHSAAQIIAGMCGLHGITLPETIVSRLGPLQGVLAQIGVQTYLGGASVFVETWGGVLGAAAICFLFPNTQQILRQFEPALDFDAARGRVLAVIAWTWQPDRRRSLLIGLLALASLLSLNRPSDFLYFQF